MSASSANTEIVRDLIAHFFNTHDVEVAEQYFATDLKWHGGLVGDIEGVGPFAESCGDSSLPFRTFARLSRMPSRTAGAS